MVASAGDGKTLSLEEAAARLERPGLGRAGARRLLVAALRTGRVTAYCSAYRENLFCSFSSEVWPPFKLDGEEPLPKRFWRPEHGKHYDHERLITASTWCDFIASRARVYEDVRGHELSSRWPDRLRVQRPNDDFVLERDAFGITLDRLPVEHLAHDRESRRLDDRSLLRTAGRPRKWQYDHALARLVAAVALDRALPGEGCAEEDQIKAIILSIEGELDSIHRERPDDRSIIVELARQILATWKKGRDERARSKSILPNEWQAPLD